MINNITLRVQCTEEAKMSQARQPFIRLGSIDQYAYSSILLAEYSMNSSGTTVQ